MNPDHTTSTDRLSLDRPSLDRRTALGLLGLGGVALLAGCASDGAADPSSTAATTDAPSTTGSSSTTGATDTAATSSSAVDTSSITPSETAGPFPADGSNDNGAGQTADVLSDGRSVRTDIRADLDGSNVQDGVPFELTMHVVRQSDGTPLVGGAVYVWHCNKDGAYSGYSSRMLDGDYSARSFLRGVQVTDANGAVTFRTILPGRYQGRAFHIHFEVFADSTYADKVLTSQMAIDDAFIDQLYAQAGDAYATSLRNDTDNGQDNIFSDGVEHQLLTITGDVGSGLQAGFVAVV